jgi:hypothetical protein
MYSIEMTVYLSQIRWWFDYHFLRDHFLSKQKNQNLENLPKVVEQNCL